MPYPRKIQIVVPCSSSNIGPGFDVLGVTLSLCLTLTIQILPKYSNELPNVNEDIVLTYSGEGSSNVPLSINQNLITKTALYVLASNNIHGFPLPMTIHINNEIPFGRGLGSSGAAVVAGVMLGDVAGNLGLTKDRLLDYCLMIERHPDNVTAALMGGFVASYLRELDPKDTEASVIPNSETLEDSKVGFEQDELKPVVPPKGIGHYIRLNWAKEIKAITIIPQFQVATAAARDALPHTYKRQDVVFNLQRLAVLTTALSKSPPDADLIFQAMQDKIHQPYRMSLIPGLSEILLSVNPKTHPGLLGICLSGAGPTILALAVDNFDSIADTITKVLKRKTDTQVTVKILDIVEEGAQVIELT